METTSAIKLALKEWIWIVSIIFLAGGFYAGLKIDLSNIAAKQDEMYKDDKEYRKDFSVRIQSLEQRATTIELHLQELQYQIDMRSELAKKK